MSEPAFFDEAPAFPVAVDEPALPVDPDPEPLPPIRHPQLGEPVDVYRYERASGGLAYVVCRFEPKDFRQAHLEEGDWVWSLDGVERILFRLPQVQRGLAAGDRVWVAEGEKDVQALEAAGVVATCNPMGAGKWTDELSEQLKGARAVRIVVDQDPDEKRGEDGLTPGERHALAVAESLPRVAGVGSGAIELVRPATGKDAADHLAARHGLDEFEPVDPAGLLEAAEREREEVAPFVGLTHDEVLSLELEEERQLIQDLVPIGAVGTIAGVPETHKSWLAQQIAVSVAKGAGAVLGCDVATGGPVGYFWQDDSTREEAERVKVYEAVNQAAGSPLHWFLNLGVQLPADIARLAATIRAHQLVLAVLDSFYNFLPGVDLKDDAAERIVAQLKREISDDTGCTVLLVDHMPWATDTNRQRLRAYGGVFKNAATRFGVYIDANGDKLSIEARGNNIRGFKKRAAYWDTDALELRLLETTDHEETVEQRSIAVAKWLVDHPGSHSTTAVRKAVGGRATVVDEALERAKARDEVTDHVRDGGTWSGENGKPRYWIATIHAASHGIATASQLFGTGSDEVGARSPQNEPRPVPYRRDEVRRDVVGDNA